MRFILGVVIGVLLFPIFVYCYFRFGYAPVSTASSPIPFERTLAHMGLDARIEKDAPKTAPFEPTEADMQNGAHLYRVHCAMCHGIPGGERSPTSKGMYPRPPQLFHGKGVTDDPPGETYWKIDHGIRLTGMPAYGQALSEKEMWQMAFLLARADKLSADVQSALKQPLHTE